MKKILVPTDGTDLSGYALTFAQKFALKSGAEIYTLKVIPTPADAVFDKNGDVLDAEDFDLEAVKTEQRKGMAAVTDWVQKMNIPAIPVVKAGNLVDQILHCVKKEQIDLVVMGTHGLTGFREIIADSVTEQVVRKSSVPVLSLKCDRSGLEIKNIVLAGNFEERKPKDLSFIKEVQNIFDAKIHLLRVNTANDFKTSPELLNSMKLFAKQNELTNVEYHIFCDKDIESGILHFTDYDGMDIISIGVEDDGLSYFFKRHISSALVNHVYHPVLTFKI